MRRYLTIINLILVAAIAYFGVQAGYRLATLPLEADVLLPGSSTAASGGGQEAALPGVGHYQIISGRNLFNTVRQAGPRANAVDLQNLARTGLKLKLWGTVSGAKGPAYAVIEDERERRQRLYRPGDEVQGASIRMILREKVVLAVDGRDEILDMEKPHGSLVPAAAKSKQAATPQSGPITLQSSEISAALGDLYSLSQQATIRPHFNQGKRDGFLLARVQPNSVFKQLGLRTGDVIKSVNGQEITSVGEALNLYKNLAPGSKVEVRIARRGEDQTLRYAIE